MTYEIAKQLVEQHDSVANAARIILDDCVGQDGGPASFHAVRMWLFDALKGELGESQRVYDRAEADKINQIKNLLEEANIPIDSIGRIDKVKIKSGFHEGLTKNANDEPEITRLRSKNATIVLSPKWEKGPDWPVVQPAKPVLVKIPVRKRPERTGRMIAVLSDTQIGFLRDIDSGKMVPIHDPIAIDVAMQIVADLQPNQIGYVGDFLDLPEMSRWLQVEEFWRTTQPAIEEGYKILAQFEAAAGGGRERTKFVAGNHDRRLREYVVKNARAAFHLRPAQATPERWPDLSIPRLLRFDDLSIDYIGEYPGGEWWITPELVVRHNPEGRDAYDASVIAGHTHRIRRETFSRRTPEGPKHQTLFEIGCLCSMQNFPDRQSLMATRVPSNRGFIKHWAQGLAIVHVDPDGDFTVDQVEIRTRGEKRKATYAGRTYAA